MFMVDKRWPIYNRRIHANVVVFDATGSQSDTPAGRACRAGVLSRPAAPIALTF
jgi:hypothetical protein